MREVSLEEAWEVHRKMLVFDGHSDTLVERVRRGEAPLNWMQRDTKYHMDVPRMKEGGFDGGFFIVGNGSTANALVTIERTLAQIDRQPGDLLLVLSSRDAEQAHATGRIGILMAIEGAGRWLGGEVDTLRLYHRLGLRGLGITHGEGGDEPGMLQGTRSSFGFCTPEDRETARRDDAGLTPFGQDVLEASNEMRIITDLAHINDKAFFEVLECSSLPVTMTHTAVFSLCPHWRCMTDDQIKALAEAAGVMGIAFVPMFIHPEAPSLDRFVEHISYVADLVGIDHVAIGSDYDGMGDIVPIVPDVSQLVELTRSMMAHGFTENEIAQVWGGNFLRLLRETIDGHQRTGER